MGVNVSVVIPVYNPGECILPGIDSLLSQTMPPGELEVIFVDDGSTDETPAMLDRLAEEHEHIQVVHQENSGWPGKPRNVGIEAALGDYVMFMDQDDALGVEAMQRMYDIGSRNDADIVIGKVTSNFRPVPHGVWRTTIEKCTIRDHNLIESLTPHKMFRRAFLLDSKIRYPEGKRRLEDQLFVVKTLIAAQCVSVLADYPCYFYLKRADGGNIGSRRPDPSGYYANLEEVLDVVDTTVEPGEFRDSLLRRFYRGEMLGRLHDRLLETGDADFRDDMFAQIRGLAIKRFPDSVSAGLAAQHRVRATLLREGRLDALTEFAGRIKQVKATATIENPRWQDGVLHADVTATLVLADGSPVQLVWRDGGYVLDPRIVGDLVPLEVASATADVAGVTVEVVLRNGHSAIQWFVPAEVDAVAPATAEAPVTIQVQAHISIDPRVVAGGTRLPPGTWVLAVRLRASGLVRGARILPIDPTAWAREAQPALLGDPAITVVPRSRKASRGVVLDIDDRWVPYGQGHYEALPEGIAVNGNGVLSAVLPAATQHDTAALPIVVELRASLKSPSVAHVDGWLQREGTNLVLRVQLPPVSSVALPARKNRMLVLWRPASWAGSPTRLGHISWSRKWFTLKRNWVSDNSAS